MRQIVGNKRVATVNPHLVGVGNGMGIIIKAGLHHWTGGVAFCKVMKSGCKDVLKMRVSDLKSAGWDFTKFSKVKKNTLYVYFLTRHGRLELCQIWQS